MPRGVYERRTSRIPNLVGQRFGLLVVASRAESIVSGRCVRAMWNVVCEGCGKSLAMRSDKLTGRRRPKSCGCSHPGAATHGHTRGGRTTPEHESWQAMMGRCYTKSAGGYDRYGGRGITVCDRWHSFENFLENMGPRPPGTSIDRINGRGNYEPGNCRWASQAVQVRNTTRVTLTERSVALIKRQLIGGAEPLRLAAEYNVRPMTIYRIRNGKRWADVAPASEATA